MKLSFFLNKVLVIQNEFQQDRKAHIFTPRRIMHLGNLSWNMGRLCALNFKHTTTNVFLVRHNIQVTTQNAPTTLYKIFFSSFCKTSNQIVLYSNNIDSYLIPNAPSNFSKSDLINLLLNHEIFHFLQCNELSTLYNINCLNEIAAYAFAREMHNMHSHQLVCTY